MTLNTLNDMIKNSSYQNVLTYINSFSNQLLISSYTINANQESIIANTLIQEFLLRIPYNQDLATFTIRFVGIINKYTVNIMNYAIKLQQQQNFLTMLTQNQSKTIKSTNDLTTSIATNNTTNEATGQSFSPTADGSIDLNLSKASSTADVTAANVRSGTIANSNFNTNQNQTQTVTHTMTEQDLIIYNSLKFEADNILQPVLTALNSLFYVFEVGGNNNDYWCF